MDEATDDSSSTGDDDEYEQQQQYYQHQQHQQPGQRQALFHGGGGGEDVDEDDDEDEVQQQHIHEDLNTVEDAAKYWKARAVYDKEEQVNVKLLLLLRQELEQLHFVKQQNAVLRAKVKTFEEALARAEEQID
eukprot:TRINITY_DN8770_c0_g1_i1.p1 TRINITY_DN8770_c0_g1~~TRINITY_DN8770_c0_g1_i1.p1  ORF type:complete len:146 (+),score=49.10 TRINITY_DN8770_c0_g1_i1:40-438(+)